MEVDHLTIRIWAILKLVEGLSLRDARMVVQKADDRLVQDAIAGESKLLTELKESHGTPTQTNTAGS